MTKWIGGLVVAVVAGAFLYWKLRQDAKAEAEASAVAKMDEMRGDASAEARKHRQKANEAKQRLAETVKRTEDLAKRTEEAGHETVAGVILGWSEWVQ